MITTAEIIAKRYHEVYEELLPTMGSAWENAGHVNKPWGELPIENKWLMVKVVEQLMEEKVIYKGRGLNAKSEVPET
jgi:hypothetical protein